MSETSRHLNLPYIQPSQAQKHLTHNEAINALDVMVHMSAISRSHTHPPENPNEGDRFLISEAGEGWGASPQSFAVFQDTTWRYFHPKAGWCCYVEDEAALFIFNGHQWTTIAPTDVEHLGISTQADQTQRFAAQTESALWTATPQDQGGSGDFLQVMNKVATGNESAIAFQTGYTTHAMFGSFGSNDITLKTSQTGETFKDAMIVSHQTGSVNFPNLPRFCARLNYNQVIGTTNWTTVGINETDYNDQRCFDPVENTFTAPETGLYQLGMNAIYRYRNSSRARLRTRLVKNTSTVLPGTQREVSSGHLNNMTGLNTVTMASLNEGDQITMQAHYRAASGYLLANETCFWGFKVG